LDYIPKKDEKVTLGWKHNLCLGANPVVIAEPKLTKVLSELALKAARALNIKFASIDIVKIGEEFKILEINSKVTMGNFAASSEENYQITKSIYKDAIEAMFEN